MNKQNIHNSVFITGANGGLGRETIKWLIEDGYRDIVMAARSEAKVQEARRELLEAFGGVQDLTLTAVGGFDMTKPALIEEAVEALPRDKQYDVIFLQVGGVIFTPDYQTVQVNGQSYEKTVFQNVLGGHITLALLRKYNLIAPNARVIAAGGEGARGLPPLIEKPNFASASELRHYVLGDFSSAKPYKPMNAIGVSKLLAALWVRKLASLEEGNLEVIWFSPGLTYGTQGLEKAPKVRRWVSENILFKIMRLAGRAQGPRDGARKYADVIGGKIGRNGDVIGAPEGKGLGMLVDQIPMNDAFTKTALRDEFWAIANEVYSWDCLPSAFAARKKENIIEPHPLLT